MSISKKRILITLSDEDLKYLDKLSNGNSRSSTISEALWCLAKYRSEIRMAEHKLFPPAFETVGNDI